jgi:hypothetical protein
MRGQRNMPVFVWWQSVVTLQLYRFADWAFIVINATHYIDLANANPRPVSRLSDGYSGALVQLGDSEVRILASF